MTPYDRTGRRAHLDELATCVAAHLDDGRDAEAWEIVGEIEALAHVRFPDEAAFPHAEVPRPVPGMIARRFARAHRALLASPGSDRARTRRSFAR